MKYGQRSLLWCLFMKVHNQKVRAIWAFGSPQETKNKKQDEKLIMKSSQHSSFKHPGQDSQICGALYSDVGSGALSNKLINIWLIVSLLPYCKWKILIQTPTITERSIKARDDMKKTCFETLLNKRVYKYRNTVEPENITKSFLGFFPCVLIHIVLSCREWKCVCEWE